MVAKAHAYYMYREGIDLETIRLWLFPRTTMKNRDEIIEALSELDMSVAV